MEMECGVQRPSLLDFASKEAFGCDDYEPKDEEVSDFFVTPDDSLHTVLEKSRRIGDRVLDGKSIAVALGDVKEARQDEQDDVRHLSRKERHLYEQWKRQRGALPDMTWQCQQAILYSVTEIEQEAHLTAGEGNESAQQGLGKRKEREREDETDRDTFGKGAEARVRDAQGGKVESSMILLQQKALAAIYRLPAEVASKVHATDVATFEQQYPPLRPLLSAMSKILHSQSRRKERTACNAVTKEQRILESHSTQKAIMAIERQVKWIMDDAVSAVDAIHEQLSLMRGRLAAVNEDEDNDDDREGGVKIDDVSSMVDDGMLQDVVVKDVREEIGEEQQHNSLQEEHTVPHDRSTPRKGSRAVANAVAQRHPPGCETAVIDFPTKPTLRGKAHFMDGHVVSNAGHDEIEEQRNGDNGHMSHAPTHTTLYERLDDDQGLVSQVQQNDRQHKENNRDENAALHQSRGIEEMQVVDRQAIEPLADKIPAEHLEKRTMHRSNFDEQRSSHRYESQKDGERETEHADAQDSRGEGHTLTIVDSSLEEGQVLDGLPREFQQRIDNVRKASCRSQEQSPLAPSTNGPGTTESTSNRDNKEAPPAATEPVRQARECLRSTANTSLPFFFPQYR